MSLEMYLNAVERREPTLWEGVAFRKKSFTQWLGDYRALVLKVLGRNRPEEKEHIIRWLPEFASDERNLRAAWRHLSRHGSRRPGPNGWTWDDFSQSETWDQVRMIRDSLRAGEYRHGPVKRIKIAKALGRGQREVAVANILDRVVARAVQQILRPWLEHGGSPTACCRFGRGPLYALALADALTRRTGRFIWGSQDVRDAFDFVPRNRLLDVIRTHVPSEPLVTLVELLIAVARKHGIPQGSPLSSLMFESYREHFLDKPWRRRQPRVPLMTYADDLLVLAHPAEQVRQLHDDLVGLLTPAGFRVKYSMEDAFADVRDAPVRWLGYKCTWQRGQLHKRPILLSFQDDEEREQAVAELTDHFARLHRHGDAYARVPLLIKGLVEYAGAGYRYVDRRTAYETISAAAQRASFEELPNFEWFDRQWRRSYAGWQRIRKRAAQSLIPCAAEVYRPPFPFTRYDDWTWSDIGAAPPVNGQLFERPILRRTLSQEREGLDCDNDMDLPGESTTDEY